MLDPFNPMEPTQLMPGMSPATATPVSRTSRLRRRPRASPQDPAPSSGLSSGSTQGDRHSSPGQGLATSTPNNLRHCSQSHDFDRLRAFRLEDDEEEEDAPYLSSQFLPRKDGEVYWNYEASPATKEQLKKWLQEADAKSPSSKMAAAAAAEKTPAVTSPGVAGLLRLVQRPRVTVVDPEVIASMKEFSDQHLQKEESGADADEGEVALADSSNDSLLVKCTQAVDESASMVAANCENLPTVEKMAAAIENSSLNPSTVNVENAPDDDNPFDGSDDSLDVLLTQLDHDSILQKQNRNDSEQKRPILPVPTVIGEPLGKLNSTVSLGLAETSVKRFKNTNSSQLLSESTTFNRTRSTPDVPTASSSSSKKMLFPCSRAMRSSTSGAVPRCTKEEIERKRLEAMKKRQKKQGNKP